ncbi:MAG: hypothetical protein ACM3MB_03345 [Acidobacteriota bacterium]
MRTLRNDFTIAHDSKLYQIENGVMSLFRQMRGQGKRSMVAAT